MRKSPFIWLGSGRTRRQSVARKARLLDQAAKAGLPVPSGGILLDEFYRICLLEGLAELAEDTVIIPDPEWLFAVMYQDVRFPHLDKLVAVRSGSTPLSENKPFSTSTRLNVDFNDPLETANALRDVWSAMHRFKNERARDVLVMEMVEFQNAGVAVTLTDEPEDHINLTLAKDLDLSSNFTVKKIRSFQRTTKDIPPFARRLQKLLRGIRRSFGKGEWRIEWADDGEICWLLQIH